MGISECHLMFNNTFVGIFFNKHEDQAKSGCIVLLNVAAVEVQGKQNTCDSSVSCVFWR